jgi:hypothetical protein
VCSLLLAKVLIHLHSGRKVWGISWVEASPQRIPQHFLLEPGFFNTGCPVPISQPIPQQTLFTHLFPNKRRYISLPNVFPNRSLDFRDAIPQPIPIRISQPISQPYYQPITQHSRQPISQPISQPYFQLIPQPITNLISQLIFVRMSGQQ